MTRTQRTRSHFDSDMQCNLAFELGMEAQRLVFCMAALSAFTEATAADGIPARPKGYMRAMSKAIYEDQSSPKEMNSLEW